MAAEVSSEYAVQMHGITKRFGSFYALTDVQLDVKKGTIHSILGENGAGKSTLMNILYGLYQADEGEIFTILQSPRISFWEVNRGTASLSMEGRPDRASLTLCLNTGWRSTRMP